MTDNFWKALTELLIVVTPLVVILTTILQTLYQNYLNKKSAAVLATKVEQDRKLLADKVVMNTKIVKETKEVTDLVRDTLLNGSGDRLGAIEAWQKDHEEKDLARHAELLGKLELHTRREP